jgi:hypothetical protein
MMVDAARWAALADAYVPISYRTGDPVIHGRKARPPAHSIARSYGSG